MREICLCRPTSSPPYIRNFVNISDIFQRNYIEEYLNTLTFSYRPHVCVPNDMRYVADVSHIF